jgi:hypothetical protein
MEEKWTGGIFIGEKTREEKAKRRAKTLENAEAHFKASLELAENALALSYLEDDDRGAIEHAIHWIKFWLPVFLKSNDADDVREAGYWLAAYNKVIGSHCEVCRTEEEYWRRQRCAKGGARKSQATEDRRRWVLEKMAKRPDAKPTAMARLLLKDKARPKNLPRPDSLARFIRAERKRDKAKIRLVHSA